MQGRVRCVLLPLSLCFVGSVGFQDYVDFLCFMRPSFDFVAVLLVFFVLSGLVYKTFVALFSLLFDRLDHA